MAATVDATPYELPSAPLVQARPLTSQELFREHAAFVWRVLRRLGVRDADVEDACQDVFLAVHAQLSRFEGRSRPRTWIYAIARRRAADYRARERRARERAGGRDHELSELSTPAPTAERELEQAQARVVLDKLLAALDDEKREVFVLYELEELSMREVAEIVGCPMQTGYSRLHAARAELRRAAQAAGAAP